MNNLLQKYKNYPTQNPSDPLLLDLTTNLSLLLKPLRNPYFNLLHEYKLKYLNSRTLSYKIVSRPCFQDLM